MHKCNRFKNKFVFRVLLPPNGIQIWLKGVDNIESVRLRIDGITSHFNSICMEKSTNSKILRERERKMSIEYGKGVYVGTCFITKCPLGLNGGIKYHLKYNETEIYCNVTKELCDEGEKKMRARTQQTTYDVATFPFGSRNVVEMPKRILNIE